MIPLIFSPSGYSVTNAIDMQEQGRIEKLFYKRLTDQNIFIKKKNYRFKEEVNIYSQGVKLFFNILTEIFIFP